MESPEILIDLFCRKSAARATKGRREISIRAQEARGRAIADELGLTVRHVWREVGSASRFRRSKKGRTEQDSALSALEKGETGALWVYRLDRWDRRGAGAILRIIEPEDGRPRRLLFDNGDPEKPGIGLDSTNPRDRKEIIRRAEDAREETEILSERVRSTKTLQRENGEWVNHSAPYGLRVVLVEKEDEDGDIVVERKLARDHSSAGDPADLGRSKFQVARAVFTDLLVTQQLSGRAVALGFNNKGIPSPSGGQWGYATIRDMVRNPAYAGWQTTGRQDGKARRVLYRDSAGQRVSVMADDEPLVTDEEQKAAQSALGGDYGAAATAEGRFHDTRAKHLLTGLLKCAACRGPMCFTGKSYQCWKMAAGNKACPAPSTVASHLIEDYVHGAWEARLTQAEPDDPLVAIVAERYTAKMQPDATADSAAAIRALTAAEADLARVWADRKSGLYTGPSESFFAPALKEANEAVVTAKKALEAAVGRRGVDITFLMDSELCAQAWGNALLPLRRTLLGLAIDHVTVTKAASRGARFNAEQRVRIKWVDVDDNE